MSTAERLEQLNYESEEHIVRAFRAALEQRTLRIYDISEQSSLEIDAAFALGIACGSALERFNRAQKGTHNGND